MQQFNKRILMSAVALLLVCGVSLQGAALAHDGVDDSASGSSSPGSSGSDGTASISSSGGSESENETTTENETHTQQTDLLMRKFRDQGKVKLQQTESSKTRHTQQQRQKSCQARSTALTNHMKNAVTAAGKHKQVFDNIYTKVKSFHDSKNLTVADYDQLVTAADAAQADAAAKIAALKALNIKVDCTQVDSLTTNVSAFREAVSATRDSLKSYRKSIVSLITALKGASTSTDKSTTNTDDNSSTNNTPATQ
jgi:hypothetical protein